MRRIAVTMDTRVAVEGLEERVLASRAPVWLEGVMPPAMLEAAAQTGHYVPAPVRIVAVIAKPPVSHKPVVAPPVSTPAPPSDPTAGPPVPPTTAPTPPVSVAPTPPTDPVTPTPPTPPTPPTTPTPPTPPTVPVTPPPDAPLTYDVDTLLRMVQPMRNALNGRAPLLVWSLPQYPGDLHADLANGSLTTFVRELAARGITFSIPVGSGYSADYLMTWAQAMQQANVPVNLLFPAYDIISGHVWQNATLWAPGTNALLPGQTYQWPALPLADPAPAAAFVASQLLPYQQAGIHVAAVWFDDEGAPDPFNGVYEAQKSNPQVAALYPPGVLDSWQSFSQWVYQLRANLQSAIMADPVHQMFPGAIVGNFNDFGSSAATPYVDVADVSYQPHDIGRNDVMMPGVYNSFMPMQALMAGQPQTQTSADAIYFSQALMSASSSLANLGDKQAIPYISADMPAQGTSFVMSDAAFKEELLHLWMRGASNMYVFPGPMAGASIEAAFHEIELAREVYDQMLDWRPFLDNGTPMNTTPPPVGSGNSVWSGLKLGDQALVRTYTTGGTDGTVTVQAFANVTVTLDAPAAGATYLISSDGRVQSVTM